MNNVSDDDRRSWTCNLVRVVETDTNFSPATAAVERLQLFPERECKRIRLLSERDDDYYEAIDQICYHSPSCILQTTGVEERTGGAFDMRSLSQISDSIAKEHAQPIETNDFIFQPSADSNAKNSFSDTTTNKDRGMIAKEQGTLVRCIALDSRLALLDSSSSSVSNHERFCPAR